jgi:pimeloyl-ACP methyl ester carboxylesterase
MLIKNWIFNLKAVDKNNLEKKYIESEKGRIYYYKNNATDNSIPVVFLHGLSSNHTTWIGIMDILEKQNVSSFALDMRGHGHSDKSRRRSWYRIGVFSKDLDDLVRHEKLDQFILVGYSFSGAAILDYISRHPDKIKSLVLISANHKNPLVYKKMSFLTPILYVFLNLLGWVLVWQKRKNYYYFEQSKSRSYWHSTLKGFGTMPLSINYWMLSELLRIDFSEALKKISYPVLLIRSAGDLFFSQKEMQAMASTIPNCKAVTINQSSHFLATAHQDKIKDLIINFIKKMK